jgi:membrane protease YdiL (CAAX protease family)
VQASLPLLLYLGQTTTTAVIYTWLWNRTRSLPGVLVLHTMTNLAAGVFPLPAPESPDDLAFRLAVAIAGLAALALVGTTHGRLGWRPAMEPGAERS